MPTPPARSSLFPTGSLSPSSAKTLFGEWFDYCVALLGSSGSATDARTALGAAADADVVKLAGTQTITGAKTFSTSPVVPTPATSDNSTKAASTAWVRASLGAIFTALGFSAVIGTTGGIAFPSILGGFVFNWGRTGTGLNSYSVTFPITFPTAIGQMFLTPFGTDAHGTADLQVTSSSTSGMAISAGTTSVACMYFAIGY
jgi:hypothetical protein